MPVGNILSSAWVWLSILSQFSIIWYMGLCDFSLPISLVMIERIHTLSYHHHQIGSMNYSPLFMVRSWNNGMHCIALYSYQMIYIYIYINICYEVISDQLILNPAWISNYFHYKVRDKMTYSFPNSNGAAIEVYKWITHFIPHIVKSVITERSPWSSVYTQSILCLLKLVPEDLIAFCATKSNSIPVVSFSICVTFKDCGVIYDVIDFTNIFSFFPNEKYILPTRCHHVSKHRHINWLLNSLFGLAVKKTSKPLITEPLWGESTDVGWIRFTMNQ